MPPSASGDQGEESAPRWSDPRRILIFAFFFLSGAAGLIYQVVWARLLGLVVGVTIFAITAVVCSFMGGLALGSWGIGRYGDRLGDPLRTYGLIEAAIAAYALATPALFQAAQPLYASAAPSLDTLGVAAFRVSLSMLLLLLPTALMGGTLPLLSRAVSRGGGNAARDVGLLYAVNTLGAVAGCLGAGFVLLAELGIQRSLQVAAGLNFAVALAALLASRSGTQPAISEGRGGDLEGLGRKGRIVFVVFLVSGFTALGYELLFTRALLVYVRSSTYAFSLMLGVYLLGVALGSAIASGPAARSARPLVGLGLCQLGIALSVLISLALFPDLDTLAFALLGVERLETFGWAVGFMFAQAMLVLLLPTLFMGAMFPFGLAAHHDSSRGIGRSVGSLYAVNTLGNIVGSLAVGFVAIPLLGVRGSILTGVGINLTLAVAIAISLAGRRIVGVGLALGAVATMLIADATISKRIFYHSMEKGRRQDVIFYREGASDTVAVMQLRGGEQHRLLVYGDGRGAAGTWSLAWNLFLGHLPMLLHPDPQNVLHICIATGNSVLAQTRHNPERIDAVELSPHVREAAAFFWTNEDVFSNPRVNLIIEDGRNYLLRTDQTYDVIAMEPPQIHAAGVVNLYTQEFYELARSRLAPGGLMQQWVPSSTLSRDDRSRVIRAFTEAFPNVTLWQQLDTTQLLMVGSNEPIAVDLDEVDRRLDSPDIRRDAEVMGVRNAEELLSYFLLGDASTRALVSHVDPIRDDLTVVDYSIPRFVGAAFGLNFDRPHGPEGFRHSQVSEQRMREYASWQDPASEIVPDPEMAARLDAAIARRRAASGTEEQLRRKRESKATDRAREPGAR